MMFTPRMPVDSSRARRISLRSARRLAAEILEQVRLDHPDPGGGDDPNPALVGHGRGQPAKRHADSHAALDDGQRCSQVPDVERRWATLGHVVTSWGTAPREA